MSRAYFVTSSGTEIGKTYITQLLCRALVQRDLDAGVLKPVMSGYDPAALEECDAGILLDALTVPVTPETVASISPWRFTWPISPDMAARRDGRKIVLDDVVRFCRLAMSARSDALFIEGAGGVMAPLNDQALMIDLAQALEIPAIVVVGSYLGTISHTLTALESLNQRRIPIAALVICESPESPVPLKETVDTIARYCPDIFMHSVKRHGDIADVDRLLDHLLSR